MRQLDLKINELKQNRWGWLLRKNESESMQTGSKHSSEQSTGNFLFSVKSKSAEELPSSGNLPYNEVSALGKVLNSCGS